MDDLDKAILRQVQSNLPIDPRPFRALGRQVGLSEDQVIERLQRLKQKGIVRRIGGNFVSSKLGFASTLCAAQVPPEKIEPFVEAVNAFSGVTHNYLRDHDYNVWFTFIAESMGDIEASLAELSRRTGVSDICSLPSLKMFKIQVDFPL